MEFELHRPTGLEDHAWDAIEACRARLAAAVTSEDLSLAIGTAKELVESTARVVLSARGDTVASNEELPSVLNRAHIALVRQPGQGLASDPTIRNIAQGAKTIAAQLPEIRNRYGTGHGRAASPEIAEELAFVAVDGAVLWSRWALRRLGVFILGSPATFAADLGRGTFRRGKLTERLQAANLATLDSNDQRLIGLAVAHRAMGGTFVVREDGVTACAASASLHTWPEHYRAGVTEGLFLDRNGLVDPDQRGVGQAANIISALPNASDILQSLNQKIRAATWSPQFAEDSSLRAAVASAMKEIASILPTVEAQSAWAEIIAQMTDRAPR
ncbi:abortive infection family protein [Actinoplanes sp. NPDC049265]|uniref:abortive infection family protein n=1 Tax=Actinoplanes sp. NPDC049265 TaxID=3363902 RepID=UPI0037213DC7